ncbi:MAG: cytochrome c biogenesis protein CcdA [Caldilineaceae bacterium]
MCGTDSGQHLAIASDSRHAAQGAILLGIYSLGLGIPFIITGLAFSSATKFLRRLNRHANIVSIVSGIFLLYVAWLLWSGSFNTLTTSSASLNEWVFALEDGSAAQLQLAGGDIIGVSLLCGADCAGSGGHRFISPCVLPPVGLHRLFGRGGRQHGTPLMHVTLWSKPDCPLCDETRPIFSPCRRDRLFDGGTQHQRMLRHGSVSSISSLSSTLPTDPYALSTPQLEQRLHCVAAVQRLSRRDVSVGGDAVMRCGACGKDGRTVKGIGIVKVTVWQLNAA